MGGDFIVSINNMDSLKNFETDLRDAVTHFKDECSGIRTNRPSSRLVEEVKVEYFGQMTPVKQLGSIMIIPPRAMAVSVWDTGATTEVAKAIEGANLGLSVSVDGSTVRLTLPLLTDERRTELIKLAKALAEKERIKVRGYRDDINKKIKAQELDEDMRFRMKEDVQKAVLGANAAIEALLDAKIEEING